MQFFFLFLLILLFNNIIIFTTSSKMGLNDQKIQNNNNNNNVEHVIITIDTTKVLSETSDISFGCVGIDWWPSSKCDYGRCAWGEASLLNLDLNNNILNNALKALTPIYVRLGGSLADFVRYEEEEMEVDDDDNIVCKPFSAPTNDTRIGYELGSGCLTMKRWDDLNSFCSKTNNCHLLFDLNALIGRKNGTCPMGTNCHIQDASKKHPCCTNWTGSWDQENAEQLLRYTYTHYKDNVYGFEFGNELVGPSGIEATLSVEQYVEDFCNLYKLINTIWTNNGDDDDSGGSKPKLITPDTAFEAEWYGNFIKLTNEKECYPDIITWHQYLLGAGVDPKVSERAMSPNTLNKQIENGMKVNETIMQNVNVAKNIPEIWIGEAGGAYNSGRHLVTDAFMSSFWYLDGFGILSEYNHQSFCRQTLIGGNYGLLNTTTFEPNPDYYALLLWQRLMGKQVFHVDVVNIVGKSMEPSYLRAYAHGTNIANMNIDDHVIGSQTPGLTILLINLSNETEYIVNITEYIYNERVEYVMNSIDLHSQFVYLNGQMLNTDSNGKIPNMNGKIVKPLLLDEETTIYDDDDEEHRKLNNNRNSNDDFIHLMPLTYGFFTFPTSKIDFCQT